MKDPIMKEPIRLNPRWHEKWVTISVAALPLGWRKVYKTDDGTIFTNECPAILLQEHRLTNEYWDEPKPNEDGKYYRMKDTHHEKPPYDTRTVLACVDEVGELEFEYSDNQVGILGPGEEWTQEEGS